MQIKIKKLNENAITPAYATEGAACFDISASEYAHIKAGEQQVIGTGLSFEIPEGFVMMVYSRSGHGFKWGVRLGNGTGVIDSDYRGELKVCLRNDGAVGMFVEVGDRIAQAMIVPVPKVVFEEVEQLSETSRGSGGFGSTGVK